MNENTLHRRRSIRSSFGVVKTPYTLSQPLDAEEIADRIARAVKGCVVIAIKPTTQHAGWAHLQMNR